MRHIANRARPLVFVLAALAGCGEADETRATCEGLGRAQHFILYGEASWLSPSEASAALTSAQAEAQHAEVALMRARDLSGEQGAPLRESLLLCEGEPLADELGLSRCSGVLVAPDLLVTAAHCLDALPCEEMLAVTGYDTPLYACLDWAFEGRRCARVLVRDDVADAAVLALEPAEDEARIAFAHLREAPIEATTEVVLVSHPLGTSTKVDLDAQLRPSATGEGRMWLRADAFSGSSGGGVLDEAGMLAGIVTAGLADLTYDRAAGCMRVAHSEGEGFERVVDVHPLLRAACEAEPEHAPCAALARDDEEGLTP